jgi:hypothetical protein
MKVEAFRFLLDNLKANFETGLDTTDIYFDLFDKIRL